MNKLCKPCPHNRPTDKDCPVQATCAVYKRNREKRRKLFGVELLNQTAKEVAKVTSSCAWGFDKGGDDIREVNKGLEFKK